MPQPRPTLVSYLAALPASLPSGLPAALPAVTLAAALSLVAAPGLAAGREASPPVKAATAPAAEDGGPPSASGAPTEPSDGTGSGIAVQIVNGCPGTTLYVHGENAAGTGLPGNDAAIASGDSWSSTLPVPWVSGRIWVCPSPTAGKSPSTDANFYSYGCTWAELTTGTNPQDQEYVNLNPTYILGIWLPLEITRTGGACSGSPCTATCSAEPTMADVQADCVTGSWSQYNPAVCLGMGPFCDPGLGAGHTGDPRCQPSYLESQLDLCMATYPQCASGFGSTPPTPFQVYGCGNGDDFLTAGFGQEVCAALNRGVVGTASDWTDASAFYPAGVAANAYSAWIHDGLGCEAYAFSYDDTSVQQGGDMTYLDDPAGLQVVLTWCPWG